MSSWTEKVSHESEEFAKKAKYEGSHLVEAHKTKAGKYSKRPVSTKTFMGDLQAVSRDFANSIRTKGY